VTFKPSFENQSAV